VVSLLLKNGADPNVANELTVTEDTALYRKQRADPNLQPRKGNPDSKHVLPLFVAAAKGNCRVIASLVNAGAKVDVVNDEGKSVVCL